MQVTEDALLPAGTEMRVDHFVAGQYVDIQGTTLGKGFQGVMKRWGFAGQPASHGNTKAHRKAGGTGLPRLSPSRTHAYAHHASCKYCCTVTLTACLAIGGLEHMDSQIEGLLRDLPVMYCSFIRHAPAWNFFAAG